MGIINLIHGLFSPKIKPKHIVESYLPNGIIDVTLQQMVATCYNENVRYVATFNVVTKNTTYLIVDCNKDDISNLKINKKNLFLELYEKYANR